MNLQIANLCQLWKIGTYNINKNINTVGFTNGF